MNEPKNHNEADEIDHPQPVPGQAPEHAVYLFESAGITERKGNVPIWLWIVTASLLVWGIYYLVVYWSAPVAPA